MACIELWHASSYGTHRVTACTELLLRMPRFTLSCFGLEHVARHRPQKATYTAKLIALESQCKKLNLHPIQDVVEAYAIQPFDFNAIEIAKCGTPCKKFTVPSIGSIIQVLFLSLFSSIPLSSLIIE